MAESNRGHKARIIGMVFAVFGICIAAPASAKWLTHRFEVDTNFGFGLPDEQVTEIETYLSRVAESYDRQGFNAPLLETTGVDGELAYVIHFTGYNHKSNVALTSTLCDGQPDSAEIHVPINDDYFGENNNLDPKLFQDLAHELFHAIQYAYPMYYNNKCGVGDWITEGTAEALGIQMAQTQHNVGPYSACQIGLRSYRKELYIGKGNRSSCLTSAGDLNPYHVKSFWRFLGEYYKKGKRPEAVKPVEPDYRYLVHFLSNTLDGADRENEYAWLDQALRQKDSHFGFGLGHAYTSFVATFADYWEPLRRDEYPSKSYSPEDSPQVVWLRRIFGGCEPISASMDTSNDSLQQFDIAPVGARCIKVIPDFHGQHDFHFIADGTGNDLLALHLAATGGEKLVSPKPHFDGGELSSVSWQLSINAVQGEALFFLVTNVANNTMKTHGQAPNIRLIVQGNMSSLGDPETSAPKEKPPGANAADASVADETASEEISAGWSDQSWQTQVRFVDRGRCEHPFRNSVCGPHTQIYVTLGAANASILAEVSQVGMSFERLTEVIGAFNERGTEVIDDVREATQLAAGRDGSRISIAIPQIEYGFSGTISNASITVSKANDDQGRATGSYSSVGPSLAGGCVGGYYPLSGEVTIDEASRYVLRGSYSARLVDKAEIVTGCEPVLSVKKIINGRFSVPWPRLDDSADDSEFTAEQLDHMLQNINEVSPGILTGDLGDDVQAVAGEKLKASNERRARRIAARVAAADPDCDCRCAAQDSANAVCLQFCAPDYNLCGFQSDGELAAQMMREPASAETSEISDLRDRFESLLQTSGASDQQRESYLALFDQMPSLLFKRQLVLEYEANR